MWVVEPGGELDLPQESFRSHCGRDLGVQHLERNRTVVPQVVGQEDRRGPPAGQLALDPIALPEARPNARQEVYGGELNPRRHSFPRPHRGDERLRLRGRLGVVLRREPLGERLIRLERAGAVTVMVEHADQSPHECFVVRGELDRPASPVRCGGEIATGLALLDQCPCGSHCRFPESSALTLEPALEVGRVRDEESFQERTSVQVRGLEPRASVDGRSEEHTSELQSHHDLVCRLLLEKKKTNTTKFVQMTVELHVQDRVGTQSAVVRQPSRLYSIRQSGFKYSRTPTRLYTAFSRTHP